MYPWLGCASGGSDRCGKNTTGATCQPHCREDTKAVLIDGPEQLPSPLALNVCVCVCVVCVREGELEMKE